MFAKVGEQVRRELATTPMALVRDERQPMKGKTAELLYCGEIIDSPAVRAAIGRAVSKLRPAYRR